MPYYYQTDEIAALLMGRRIVDVSVDEQEYAEWTTSGTLTLDNGTVLEVEANQGGCACSAGDYWITSLSTCDNVITNVEVVAEDVSGDGWDESYAYKIFVYTAHDKIAAVEIDGSDGNGYYGTGYWIGVKGESRWG